MTGRVEVDWTPVERGMAQLSAGLTRASSRVGLAQATRTATAIRANVPVRSGRLRSTVAARALSNGGQVSYGGGLPYASYIEGRTHAVEDATDRAESEFEAAMITAGHSEVNRL